MIVEPQDKVGDDIAIKTVNGIPRELYINGNELSGVTDIKINGSLTPDKENLSITITIGIVNSLEINTILNNGKGLVLKDTVEAISNGLKEALSKLQDTGY